MERNDEIQQMLKNMVYLDLIVGLVLGILVYLINPNYVLICLLGFFLAIVSFYINSYTVKYILTRNKENSKVLIILGYFLRIFLVGIIGVVLFTHNRFNIIAYTLGYTFRFLSLILYGLSLKSNNEGGE
ncbi:ATP synthase subunit I [Clostridium bovifaecis]|uniref:ATP synthase subunit I n=1 Tax=Clostridium bovifaecis TaxID=2184719 RepID=A0A6I6ETK6_9CLOT|nr:ATP synthase subunit I [Clostridium bovifaecis]